LPGNDEMSFFSHFLIACSEQELNYPYSHVKESFLNMTIMEGRVNTRAIAVMQGEQVKKILKN
jgi:hypothetical protein